ncbi:MAG: nucleoside phosphorylase [Candidatus Coproplasma sp.]
MIEKDSYPIIEFDPVSPVVIDIKKNIKENDILPERCVISFFGKAVKDFAEENGCRRISSLIMESIELPIYETIVNGQKVAFMHGLGSGPYAAGQIEKLSAMGCKKFMVCGGCGVLERNSTVGDIFVPILAVRDEGTSYHYVDPSREISIDPEVENKICSYLDSKNISYKRVKTWTTDAMYRETKAMIELRKKEGCHVVEMECASFYAVAQYKQLTLGQLLYAGDDLSGEKWDSRNWKNNHSARYNLFTLTLDIVSNI